MSAGPIGHFADEPLVFAGGLASVALVLVSVSIRTAHRDVVLMALELADALELSAVVSTHPSVSTAPLVTHTQVTLPLGQVCAVAAFASALSALGRVGRTRLVHPQQQHQEPQQPAPRGPVRTNPSGAPARHGGVEPNRTEPNRAEPRRNVTHAHTRTGSGLDGWMDGWMRRGERSFRRCPPMKLRFGRY